MILNYGFANKSEKKKKEKKCKLKWLINHTSACDQHRLTKKKKKNRTNQKRLTIYNQCMHNSSFTCL